jgi:hypothetical protein
MKAGLVIFPCLTLFACFALAAGSADAALIAHYTFDVDNSGSTPDSVGANSATLGDQVGINTTVAGRIGSGVLEMTHLGTGKTAASNGAVTSNSYSWSSDARTITFWWKAKATQSSVGQDTNMVSFGDTSANGTRFDVKQQPAFNADLRVEIQGTGGNTTPGINDGNWHFVAVTVPNNATFADVSWYVNGSTTDLNPSTNTLPVATGTGPLVFGDSIVLGTGAVDDRTPNGYLDDFQLYDEVLDQTQISFLYNNPGDVIGAPVEDFESYITDPTFGINPSYRGFGDDPDGDNLANGLEAWFGTHPGEFNAGLTNISANGTTTTFTHPQNGNRPADIIGFYEWSPNLIDWYAGDGVDGPPGGPTVFFSAQTVGTTTTVTAVSNGPMARCFLRAGATQL